MKQQIWVIHGGNAFERYEDYLAALKAKSDITLERLRSSDWKMSLETCLGSEFEVYAPHMPNKQNAKYLEWKIYFEKLIPLMNAEVLLIGHSLGGIFLAKYLSEELFPKKILGTLLVAAPFNTPTHHPLADFVLGDRFTLFAQQAEKILLYQSEDDVVVPYSNVNEYQRVLPQAILRRFLDRGHFNGSTFPEIVEDIRMLSINTSHH